MFFRLLAPPVCALLVLASTPASAGPCAEFAGRLPNVSATLCESAGLQDMQARSVKQRTIWGRDLAPQGATLRVLVVGGIHGDEMSSSAVVFHWIRLAATPPADMPQPVHWRFIPTLNPDGFFARPPKRVNANGVDLNRNFPTPNWTRDAAVYWEKRTKRDPRRWPGNKPLSEPESRFLNAQMDSFKPNLIVSIHAPYGVLDFDGPSVPPSKLGRLYLDQVGIYPGSLGNYGGIHRRVPVVTVELPSASRTPLDAEMNQMWTDLLRWASERLAPGAAVAGPAHGTATGTGSSAGAGASVQ
jgi:murein peptide amidase A